MRQLILLAVFVAGCSSSSDSPATATDSGTGGGDTSVEVATDTPAGDGGNVCGAAPLVSIGGDIIIIGATGNNPAKGVKITSPNCPGYTFDEKDGHASGKVTRSVPIRFRLEATGAIPALSPEYKIDADFTFPGAYQIYSTDYSGLVPEIASTGAILVGASPTTKTAPCDDDGGVTFKVMDGATEVTAATIKYYDPVGKKLGAGPTVSGGPAIISGVPNDKPLQIVATKTGCKIAITAIETGNVYVTPGALTSIDLLMSLP